MRIQGLLAALLIVAGTRLGHALETAAPEKPVHRYLKIEISPAADFVASVEGDSPPGGYYPDVRELVIRRVKDGAAVRIALPCGHEPQCWPDSPAWSPDGKHVTLALRTPGSHARSLYRVGSDGKGLTKLVDFNGTIDDLRYGPDGRLAMLATADAVKEVGATEEGAPIAGDLAALPPPQRIAILENGSLRMVSPPELYVYEYDWRPGRKGFVATASPGNGDANWWIANLYGFPETGGAPRVMYVPLDRRQQITSPKVSRDGQTVAFIAGIMSDFGSTGGDVYTLSMDGGAPANLTPGMRASASALAWRCDGSLMAEQLSGDTTQFVDLGPGGRPTPSKVLWTHGDSLNIRAAGISLACPSEMLAAAHESFTQPPEIEVGAQGHWRNLTSENAGLSLAVQAKSIWWTSDEFTVQGWLLLPSHAEGRLPMVTVVHGGPSAATTPRFASQDVASTLLQNGYAVFWPNPRGSFGQGERFTQANVRDFGHGDLRDILAGIDAAARAAPIDTARLGLYGGSYGGFMTMWAVTQTDRFKAAVADAGISNWLSYYGENGIDEWMLPFFGASVYEDPAVYAASSAINFIRNVKTPTFVFVGEHDIECPAPQTAEFWHALKALNVPTSIMIYPGEGHALRHPDHVGDATRRSVAWFDRYLKGT